MTGTNQAPDAATQDTIVCDASVSTGSGLSVDISTTIAYPEGYGLYAITLLDLLPQHREGVINELLANEDPSVTDLDAAPTTAPQDADRNTITMDATVTTESGVAIPMTVTIDYPVGYGALILNVLETLPKHSNDVLRRLINKQDASVIAAVLKNT